MKSPITDCVPFDIYSIGFDGRQDAESVDIGVPWIRPPVGVCPCRQRAAIIHSGLSCRPRTSTLRSEDVWLSTLEMNPCPNSHNGGENKADKELFQEPAESPTNNVTEDARPGAFRVLLDAIVIDGEFSP